MNVFRQIFANVWLIYMRPNWSYIDILGDVLLRLTRRHFVSKQPNIFTQTTLTPESFAVLTTQPGAPANRASLCPIGSELQNASSRLVLFLDTDNKHHHDSEPRLAVPSMNPVSQWKPVKAAPMKTTAAVCLPCLLINNFVRDDSLVFDHINVHCDTFRLMVFLFLLMM